jgi:hypothetical protein
MILCFNSAFLFGSATSSFLSPFFFVEKAINLLQLVDFNEIKMALQNGHHLMQQLHTFNNGGLKPRHNKKIH